MDGSRISLSKTQIDELPVPEDGERRYWDTVVTGLCLRVYSSGKKVYWTKYRVGSKQRWFKIGAAGARISDHETLTVTAARSRARSIIGAAVDGIDRAQERRDARRSLTVGELIDQYLEEGPTTVRRPKRESSWKADRGNLTHHVKPLIGDRPLRDIARSDIAKMIGAVSAGKTAKAVVKTKARGRATVRGGPGIATRVLAATSAMFSWAVEHDHAKENPCRGIKLDKRAGRERFLSVEEARTLLSSLDDLQEAGAVPKTHADIVRLLLFTGARRGEINDLQWSEVDLERRRLVLPPERTKAGGKTGTRRIPLSASAVDILSKLNPKADCPFVFPSSRTEGPTRSLSQSWDTIRTAAMLDGLRLHDLRHSFASFAVADGASLYLVSKVLGHADPRTSERYAHITDEPLLALADRAGSIIGGDRA